MNDLNQYIVPGVHPHKQTELITHWWKHLPVGHQDVTCPRPPEEIEVKFKIYQEGK